MGLKQEERVKNKHGQTVLIGGIFFTNERKERARHIDKQIKF